MTISHSFFYALNNKDNSHLFFDYIYSYQNYVLFHITTKLFCLNRLLPFVELVDNFFHNPILLSRSDLIMPKENGIMVEDISFLKGTLPDSVNSCFYSPITSLISYMPGSLSARNSAADNAPLAKTALE